MRELSPAARLKLEELANQPRATFKQRLALLHLFLLYRTNWRSMMRG